MQNNLTLFQFNQAKSVDPWFAVDDRVMGGISNSELVWTKTHARFQGVVSPENNGGFCSVRSPLPKAIPADHDHLWIESIGDTKLYSMSVRTSRTPRGINYMADFKPTDSTTRIELPLTEFAAQFRGRSVVDAPELQAQDIIQLGIMISDAQYGAFQLDLKAIGAANMDAL